VPDPTIQPIEVFFALAAAGLLCWLSLFLPEGWR
jgi:hypothetical protein